MGKSKGIYNAEFPEGTTVRIVEKDELERFLADWKAHNPLRPEQLEYAGCSANVTNVFFYHGGDELYELADLPGIWHEHCLARVDSHD